MDTNQVAYAGKIVVCKKISASVGIQSDDINKYRYAVRKSLEHDMLSNEAFATIRDRFPNAMFNFTFEEQAPQYPYDVHEINVHEIKLTCRIFAPPGEASLIRTYMGIERM